MKAVENARGIAINEEVNIFARNAEKGKYFSAQLKIFARKCD